MQTLWKQDQSLHPTFAALNQCLREDWFLLQNELRLQRAHAVALEAAGILTADEHAAIGRGLDALEEKYAGRPCPTSEAEDLHTWIETSLISSIGEAGKKIHTARSRNDQVATLLAMYVVASGENLSTDLRRLVEVICDRATKWSELSFPLQTHCQFAAPGTVGFWVLRYGVAFDRIRRHGGYLVSQWRCFCPLGSGAVAGSSIPIDRQLQASELGFGQPSMNALYSTTTRDGCVEFLALAAQTALHLQSLATDVINFSQTSLAWTVYPREFATGSSMMPNKSNPDAMELLRGECSAICSAHGHAVLLLKGLPSGYNRDLQCIKPIVRDTAEKLRQMCALAAAFIERLDFDAAHLAASMNQGNIGATLQMEQMVNEGMPLREAHHVLANALHSGGSNPMATELPDLSRYQTIGSANPAETRQVAAALVASLEAEA